MNNYSIFQEQYSFLSHSNKSCYLIYSETHYLGERKLKKALLS